MDDQLRGGRISRRAAVSLLLSAAAVHLAAACSPPPAAPTTSAPPPPPSAPTPAPPATQAAQSVALTPAAAPTAAEVPKSGGTLRMGMTSGPATLDGHLLTPPSLDTVFMVYDRLTEYDAKLQPQPRLAESWDFSADNKQIKLNLRKGVQYHSGREFTNDDVKYNLLRVRDPKVASAQLAPMSAWWTDIQTPDPYTVILTSEQPHPGVFDMFESMNMVDQQTASGPDAATRAVGTGPFMLTDYQQGDHLTFTRNPHYWQSGLPYLDGVQVQLLGDPQSMVVALESGALDAADSPSVSDAVRLRQNPAYQLLAPQTAGVSWLLAANCTMPPTDNKLVRQALNYAIDRQRAFETVMHGIGEPRATPWPSTSPAYDPAQAHAYAFDLDKARSLLQQAGASNLQIDISFGSASAEYASFAQIYQADLAQIGVQATIKPTEASAFLQLMNNVSYNGVVINLVGYANLGEPSTFFTIGRTYNYALNIAGYKSDQYAQLVQQAATQPDAAARKQLYAQLNNLILDESFIMPIGAQPPLVLARANVHGMDKLVSQALTYGRMWLS